MSDIVDRLRTGRSDDSHFVWTVTPTHIEAADEITRLRQLLSEAEKREREARSKALEKCVNIIDKASADICALEKVNRSYVSRMLHIASMEVSALQSEGGHVTSQ